MPDIVKALGMNWSDFGLSKPNNTMLASLLMLSLSGVAILAGFGIGPAQMLLKTVMQATGAM